jgi:alginate O-acetyltransferase complex protein AlgI
VRSQNALVVLASYVFYAWWDWRFTPLLLAISLVNYFSALAIERATSERTRKRILILAVSVSLGALAAFKYFNFFVDTAAVALRALGLGAPDLVLEIALPLGISFMTFQGLAYVVDVWRRDHAAEPDLVKFLAFKAFFPQLIAGPIERASNLLDQFGRPRSIDSEKVARAIWLIVYGYAMKIVVADSMSQIVNAMFVPDQPFGWSTILATVAFGLQIYGDFCGYSLIAKGLALLFGFELIWNFRFPYWATSPSDFWRRWHISLSRWLRDYLYIPLGGNRHGHAATARNLLITMTLGGLWHGASWNFVLWGLVHGLALVSWRFVGPDEIKSVSGRVAGWAVTMTVVFIGWFLFRATSTDLIFGMLGSLRNMEWAPVHTETALAICTVLVPLVLLEWWQQRRGDFAILAAHPAVTHATMACLVCLSLVAVRYQAASFIYFQF